MSPLNLMAIKLVEVAEMPVMSWQNSRCKCCPSHFTFTMAIKGKLEMFVCFFSVTNNDFPLLPRILCHL